MSYLIQGIGFLGFLVSFLAWRAIHHDKNWCDFNKRWQCTAILKSSYGKTVFVHNAFWGMAYYLIIIALDGLNVLPFALLLSIFAVLASLYLAKIQSKLKQQCILCWMTYSINLLLLILIYLDLTVFFLP